MKDLARWLKATAEETRLRVLYLLARHGELCVCDIHHTLDVPQSRASRHLRTLREAGLVVDRRAGMWTHYALVPGRGPRAELLRQLLAEIDEQGEGDHLDRRLAAWRARKAEVGPCAAVLGYTGVGGTRTEVIP